MALEDMGVEEHLREQLSDESGLSPTILRRRLALTPELRLPYWASEMALLRKLMTMLLAGAWNRTVEADHMMVAELAGNYFVEVEEEMIDILEDRKSVVMGKGVDVRVEIGEGRVI